MNQYKVLPTLAERLAPDYRISSVDLFNQTREKSEPDNGFVAIEVVPPHEGGTTLYVHVRSNTCAPCSLSHMKGALFASNRVYFVIEEVRPGHDSTELLICKSMGIEA